MSKMKDLLIDKENIINELSKAILNGATPSECFKIITGKEPSFFYKKSEWQKKTWEDLSRKIQSIIDSEEPDKSEKIYNLFTNN